MFHQLKNLAKHLKLCVSGFVPAVMKKFKALPEYLTNISGSAG